MSQTLTIRRIKHAGAPVYLGDDDGVGVWSADPEKVMQFLCDGYRTRFNQHRALRSKYVWGPDPDNPDQRIPLYGADGQPVLETLGTDPLDISDKQARQQFTYLAGLPMQVIQHSDRAESTEWFAAAKRRKTKRAKGMAGGTMPRFRIRKHGDMRFGCWHNGGKNAVLRKTGRRSGVLVIKGRNPSGKHSPGQRYWQLRITVRLSADIIPYTSVMVDWAKKRVTLVSPPPERHDAHTGAVVGVDRGVAHAAATSDGEFYDMPDTTKTQTLRAWHQKAMSRSRRVAEQRGKPSQWQDSKRRAEHKRLAGKHSRKMANVRKDFADQLSHRLVRDYDVIAFEDLNVRSMTRSAKGTVEQPGTKVAQKRGLNRRILESGWGALLATTEDKARRAGKTVLTVDPRYTSQRCHECGHVARENRESQAVFLCVKCGHAAHADVNAALNVLAKAIQGRAGPRAGRGAKTRESDAERASFNELQTPALLALSK